MSRIESPNSINTYELCPRKYYYTYKLKLPRKKSIAMITGKAVHDCLERFYSISLEGINEENYIFEFKQVLFNLFNESWAKAVPSLLKLEDDKDTIRDYYEQSLDMLNNFLVHVVDKVNGSIKEGLDVVRAFLKLRPKTEIYFVSEKYRVQGYVDAIHEDGDEITIIDYKTSKRDYISDEYKRQLAIYALLHYEMFGSYPKKVGLFFLRHGTEKIINVDEGLIEMAKEVCCEIHTKTVSDDIKNYPRSFSILCKWNSGRCDFYDICFEQKSLDDFS